METLYTLAEIAIGMAGFSAIVVVFRRRESGSWLPADADRFNGMVIHSIAAVFFCVLPAAIGAFSESQAAVWRIGSAVLGLQIAAHATLVVGLSTTDPVTRWMIAVPGAVIVLLQAANVFGVGFSAAFGPYLLGVLWHLVHAGVLFVLLVWVRVERIERS